jgi:hypothetical protein
VTSILRFKSKTKAANHDSETIVYGRAPPQWEYVTSLSANINHRLGALGRMVAWAFRSVDSPGMYMGERVHPGWAGESAMARALGSPEALAAGSQEDSVARKLAEASVAESRVLTSPQKTRDYSKHNCTGSARRRRNPSDPAR